MDKIKLWQNVSDNIQFYTYKTRFRIPEESGLYAWYLPFHIWNGDISKAVNFYQAAMLYDSGVGDKKIQFSGKAKREEEVRFNWDSINISLEKLPTSRRSDFSEWDNLKEDKQSYKSIEEALMKATMLSRPLYVGRAKDIRVRYNYHIDGKSGFYERFSAFIDDFNENIKSGSTEEKIIPLKVTDLVFAALPIGNVLEVFDKDTTTLIESVLMNIIQPPFSKN